MIDKNFLRKLHGSFSKADKIMFARKREEMDEVLSRLREAEIEIQELIAKKQPLMDQLEEMRQKIVPICVHPTNLLVENADGTISCKFCNKKIRVV